MTDTPTEPAAPQSPPVSTTVSTTEVSTTVSTPEATAAPPEGEWPYRVADAWDRGWLGDGKGNYSGYDLTAVAGEALLASRPLAEVEAEAGPIRPVRHGAPADDRVTLHALFEVAGRKTIGCIASALDMLFDEARNRYDPARHGDTGPGSGDYYYAQRSLTAGRPGSWEAQAILAVVMFGNELNLYPRRAHASAAEMRATGPNPKRVNVEVRDRIADILRRWTTSPTLYVEVPESLAWLIGEYADERYGPDGWKHIADQWIQPGSLAQENFEGCYRLLYSTSGHFQH